MSKIHIIKPLAAVNMAKGILAVTFLTLFDLHRAIQEAISFDAGHLFKFIVGPRRNKKVYALGQFAERDEEAVEETRLSDLGLRKGSTFYYLFDFGDCWNFTIKIRQIIGGRVQSPELLESINEAPEQYPETDDIF